MRVLVQEGRLRLDRQIAELRALETRITEIIRSNAIVIGLVVAAAGLGVDAAPRARASWIIVPAAAGVALLIAAMILSLVAYRRARLAVGIGRARRVMERDPTEEDALRFVAEVYDEAADRNQRVLDGKGALVGDAFTTTIGGLVTLAGSGIALMLVMFLG